MGGGFRKSFSIDELDLDQEGITMTSREINGNPETPLAGGLKISSQRRGIYLLPNLFTTAALFCGFYAIVAGLKGEFSVSAVYLFVAMLMDTLDGRIARLTGSQSSFGAQYDSLSDMVCFGLAPALIIYSWSLSKLAMENVGWLIAFFYTATTALRLARFNVQPTEKRYFVGLPCPAAAAVVMGFIWVSTVLGATGEQVCYLSALITAAMGILMVSGFKYYSFKEIDFKGHVSFKIILSLVLLLSIVAWNPPFVLFALFFLYSLSGIALWLKQRKQRTFSG